MFVSCLFFYPMLKYDKIAYYYALTVMHNCNLSKTKHCLIMFMNMYHFLTNGIVHTAKHTSNAGKHLCLVKYG